MEGAVLSYSMFEHKTLHLRIVGLKTKQKASLITSTADIQYTKANLYNNNSTEDTGRDFTRQLSLQFLTYLFSPAMYNNVKPKYSKRF